MLAWSERGEGPPLLLINGYAATKDDWDPTFLDELASAFHLICPDNRGVGESELGDAGEMTAASLAGDCIELLDSLGVERAAVVGWSMGGMVAQELAAAEPERVSALVLLSTDCGGEKAVLAEPETIAKLYDRSGTTRQQATRLLDLLFPPEVAAPIDAEFGEVVAAARAALNPEALDAQQALMERWHREPADDRLTAITAKTLVAAGDEDEVIPPANTPILAAALGGAQMHRFPGDGHAFMAQEPQRLAALIRIFIEAT